MLRLAAPERRDSPRLASAAATVRSVPRYAHHVPECTLRYALVQAHYPDVLARLAAEDRSLPEHVREEFEDYLRCGVLEHGCLRVVCESVCLSDCAGSDDGIGGLRMSSITSGGGRQAGGGRAVSRVMAAAGLGVSDEDRRLRACGKSCAACQSVASVAELQ